MGVKRERRTEQEEGAEAEVEVKITREAEDDDTAVVAAVVVVAVTAGTGARQGTGSQTITQEKTAVPGSPRNSSGPQKNHPRAVGSPCDSRSQGRKITQQGVPAGLPTEAPPAAAATGGRRRNTDSHPRSSRGHVLPPPLPLLPVTPIMTPTPQPQQEESREKKHPPPPPPLQPLLNSHPPAQRLPPRLLSQTRR